MQDIKNWALYSVLNTSELKVAVRLKLKRWRNIYWVNINQQKAGETVINQTRQIFKKKRIIMIKLKMKTQPQEVQFIGKTK